MNRHSQRAIAVTLSTLGILAYVTTLASCAPSYRHQLVFEKEVELPSGRFQGPLNIKVPTQSKESLRDFVIVLELESRCAPLFTVAFQDGEKGKLGSRDQRWQALLQSRAAAQVHAHERAEAAPDEIPHGPIKSESVAPSSDAQQPPATESQEKGLPARPYAPQTGRWQASAVESWPGQIQFMQERDLRCSQQKTYTKKHITAFAKEGKLSLWSEVPQELLGGSLKIRIYERIDDELEEEVRAANLEKERKKEKIAKEAEEKARRLANMSAEERAQLQLELKARREASRPAPRKENPPPPGVAGAKWSPGYWRWVHGKWVWVRGRYLMPKAVPALRLENRGSAPIAGCRWAEGHWRWEYHAGRWEWVPGHWQAPPPKQEVRGNPEVPEQKWESGRWISAGASFRWISGHWGKPRPRKEIIPKAPFAGAKWRRGLWLRISGKWKWSPGAYVGANGAPPAPKQESPSARPNAQAIWLRGFWRWNNGTWNWIAGHWELPPGVGYVWVPDPPDTSVGYSISGHWEIEVDLSAEGNVR